jgi:excisionase family DNA binding protein
MNTIKLYELTPNELTTQVNEGLKTYIENLIKTLSEQKSSKKEFLSRKETAEFFGVSLPTIHSWINEGLISSYKMGNRTYFKRSELIEQLLNSKSVA